MPAPVAIVFDLDDTLYPERDYVLSGFAAAGRCARDLTGLTGFAETCTRLFTAGERGHIFDKALRAHGRDPDPAFVAQLVAAYRAHQPVLVLHDDARLLLDRWVGSVPLGLITDGPAAVQRNKILALGLAERLDAIQCTDALGGRATWKPHPAAFLSMAEQVSAERYIYVADNPAKDFVAPNALGWLSIRIHRPNGEYATAATAPGGAPHHEITDLAEVAELIQAG